MMCSKNFARKANQFRKQNWSAPTIMSAFIVVCMVLVFSFESIGLLNKEKNLDFRITTPETIIKTVSDVRITKKEADSKTLDAVSERTLISQLKKLTQKNKEDNLQMMMRILIDGATQQDHYLNDLERSDAFMNESEEFDIFDV